MQASNELEFVATGLKDDFYTKQSRQWKAHADAIKYLSVINETEGMSLFSAGLDNMAKLWTFTGELLGVLKQGNKYKASWNFPLRANIYADKQEKAVDIIAKMAKLPKSSERFGSPKQGDKRAGFTRLTTRMVQESPPVITDKEMIRNLKEVEKLLPRDSLYEGLKEGKTFRAKKTKKPG